MIIARFRESRYLVRESEVFIKDKTKVASSSYMYSCKQTFRWLYFSYYIALYLSALKPLLMSVDCPIVFIQVCRIALYCVVLCCVVLYCMTDVVSNFRLNV